MTGIKFDCNTPGWRIEQNFSPGVLIGNWSEERLNFNKENYSHNSTHRTDFRNFGTSKPDVILRQQGHLRNKGLPRELVFNHHGNRYANNLVTSYDEDFNGRWREKNLPELRVYDPHIQAWLPEKSDIAVQEPPTNFGLLAKLQREWAVQMAEEARGLYLTTYNVSYHDFPYNKLLQKRYAVPRPNSTTIHPVNKTLKDLHLRNLVMMKSPERLPVELTTVSI